MPASAQGLAAHLHCILGSCKISPNIACIPTLPTPNAVLCMRAPPYSYIFTLTHHDALQSYEPASSHLPPIPTIQLRPYIEVKVQGFARLVFVFAGVEIYYIFDLLATPIYYPVMTVEGRLIPHPGVQARLGRQGGSQSAERFKAWSATPRCSLSP